MLKSKPTHFYSINIYHKLKKKLQCYPNSIGNIEHIIFISLFFNHKISLKSNI